MTSLVSLVHFPKLHVAHVETEPSAPLLELTLDAFVRWARGARLEELRALQLLLVPTLEAALRSSRRERCGDLRLRLDVVEARLERLRSRRPTALHPSQP